MDDAGFHYSINLFLVSDFTDVTICKAFKRFRIACGGSQPSARDKASCDYENFLEFNIILTYYPRESLAGNSYVYVTFLIRCVGGRLVGVVFRHTWMTDA